MDANMLFVGQLVKVNTGKHNKAPAIIATVEAREGVMGAVVNFSAIFKKRGKVPPVVEKPPEWFPAAHLTSRE